MLIFYDSAWVDGINVLKVHRGSTGVNAAWGRGCSYERRDWRYLSEGNQVPAR